MAFDGIVMRAVALELNQALSGARVDKIYQPTKNEVVLMLRQPGFSYRLLLSALASEAAVYLTAETRKNPEQPPMFCMVLRKHLLGAKITGFKQQGLERVLEISFETADELGEPAKRSLMAEIMGKHSNIILLNSDSNTIIDALHRLNSAQNRYRQILPGFPYQGPPAQEKTVVWETDEEGFREKILSQSLSKPLSQALLAIFAGMSPQTAEELVFRAGLPPSLALEFCGDYELNRLWQILQETGTNMKNGSFEPVVVLTPQGRPLAFSALALTGFEANTRLSFATMNEAVDYYYRLKTADNRFLQMKNSLTQIIKKQADRCEKKAGLQLSTIKEAQDAAKYRLWGELLTANLFKLRPGTEVTLTNYYDPENRRETIPLAENLSILENAQRYFKKYQKAKNAGHQARLVYEETQTELQYLQSLAGSLDNVAHLDELEDIKEELIEAGYLKPEPTQKSGEKGQKRKAAEKKSPSPPQKIILEDWVIYLGKNNKQNDFLVKKVAGPDDIWLHTKDIPGAHVIIKNPGEKPVPPLILEKAACLAAYHSQARNSKNVPVDYTLKKHVWKLKGAKPGMVHYENQRTIYVTPVAEEIEALLAAAQD